MNWSDPTDPPHRFPPYRFPTLRDLADPQSLTAFLLMLGGYILLTLAISLLLVTSQVIAVCYLLAFMQMAAVLGGIWLFYRHKAFGLALVMGGVIVLPLIYLAVFTLGYYFSG